MKNFKKFLAASMCKALIVGLPVLSQAANVTDPSVVNIKIYQAWISPNTDCSDMIRIYRNDSPSYQNMMTGPTFGEGAAPAGTYQCVAWLMGDVINYKPKADTTNGGCKAGTSYTSDLFRNGSTSIGPDGSTTTGSGTDASPVEDKMWIYFSRTGAFHSGDDGGPNTPSHALPLSSNLVIGGSSDATLVTDFTDKIEDHSQDTGPDSRSCELQPPVFSFR